MFRLNRRRPAWKALPLQERLDMPGNPLRGMYVIRRMHADSLLLDEGGQAGQRVDACQVPEGHSLLLLEINLEHFREGPLSGEALQNVETALAHFRDCGVQLILRFLYDWDGQGALHEPATMQIIMDHMTQLAPLLKAYGPTIYILQGLFTGSWGEMHGTRFSSPACVSALTAHLLECTSSHTFLALRCPSYWRTACRSLTPAVWSDVQRGAPSARISLYNDAILGSETDLGTYGSMARISSLTFSDAWCREDEMIFQNQLCRYVPNGGEAVNTSQLNDAPQALRTLRQMRLSYLNSEYDGAVLDKWRGGSRSGLGGIFRKADDLTCIRAHLGYRYLLAGAQVPHRPDAAGCWHLKISLVNHGFAPCYRPMEVALMLSDGAGAPLTTPIQTDIRTWLPEQEVILDAVLPALERGRRYQAGLMIRCPLTGGQIHLLNTPDPTPGQPDPMGELLL